MRSFVRIALGELSDGRLAIVAAALLGVVAWGAPWWLLARRHTPDEVRAATAICLLVLFEAALILLRGTRFSRDLREGRLAFFYSRPIPGAALWLGRLAGNATLALLTAALIVSPAALAHEGGLPSRPPELDFPFLAIYEARWVQALDAAGAPPALGWAGVLGLGLGGIVGSLALVHALTTMARTRNLWLVVDLGGLATLTSAAVALRERLVAEQAMAVLVAVERRGFLGLVLALIAAGTVQAVRGRSDPERSRAVLSGTLWPVLLIGVAALWSVAAGALSAVDPEALQRRVPLGLADGEWLVVGGTTPGGHRLALAQQVADRRTVRLGPWAPLRRWMAASADGSTLVWVRCRRLSGRDCELWRLDLQGAGSQPRATGIGLGSRSFDEALVLSDDGSRVALWLEDREVAIWELATARLLAAVREPRLVGFHFAGEAARIYRRDGQHRIEIAELPLDGRRAPLGVGHLDAGRSPRILRHPVTGHLLVLDVVPPQVRVVPADGGAPLGAVPGGGWSAPHDVRFLRDGRTVLLGVRPNGRSVRVLSAVGEVSWQLELDPGWIRLGDEIAPGRVLLGRLLPGDGGRPRPSELWQIDADRGTLTLLARDAVPVRDSWNPPRWATGGLLEALDGAVEHWDAASGSRQPVLAPEP